MSKNDSSFERLLTVSIPETKHGELLNYAKRHDFANFSALVRFALESFDAKKSLIAPEAARQVSFRIPDELRAALDKQAKKSGVSLGHLIRSALDSLPEKPASSSKSAAKTTPKKVIAKKAAAPAKKAPAKKATKPAKKGRK